MSPLRERALPLTGAVSAAVAALAYITSALWVPHAVAVLLALVIATLLSRGWGERGLAALCDAGSAGIGSQSDGARRPPSIDAAGAAAIALALLARLELLSSIDPSWVAAALICAAAISRGFAAIAIRAVDPAQPRSWMLDRLAPLALGLAPAAAIVLWSGELSTIVKAGAIALAAAATTGRIVRRRMAHDRNAGLAAIQQVAEIAFLAGLLAALPLSVDPHAET